MSGGAGIFTGPYCKDIMDDRRADLIDRIIQGDITHLVTYKKSPESTEYLACNQKKLQRLEVEVEEGRLYALKIYQIRVEEIKPKTPK